MAYLLGVDAGNSKTVALVAEAGGRIVGWGRSGCGDISNPRVGTRAALANVAAAVTAALEVAGVAAEQLAASAFSLAGADWPEDFEVLQAGLGSNPWGRDAVIVNDAIGALRAGTPDGYGVAVVCGTYATSAARTADGRSWHASFWQETGGGYALAAAALRAVYRSELGIDPATALTTAALTHFDRDRVEDILHAQTARGVVLEEPDIARFAPRVLDVAAEEDVTAKRIVIRQAGVLGDYALAAARQVGLAGSAFDLVLSGSVFRHRSNLLAEVLVARVKVLEPEVRPTGSRFEPAVGALLLALERLAGQPGPEVLEQLAASSPPGDLFET